ncbi:MAG: lysylphosphatidylglycerol synthase transmembrane domain-containing protein [Planctomycetota bacterium]|jgi:uncharacterized membrane protein YbhN (UPF0104 family)
MTDTSKKLLKLTVRIAGTSVLLIWVFSKIEFSQIAASIGSTKLSYVAAAWALSLVTCWLRSVKMRLILERQDCRLNTSKIFAATAVTALYNLLMPGFISSAVKWYIIRSHTGKGHKVLSGMIYNQMSDIVTLLALGLIALMITNPGDHPYLPVVCGLLLLAVVVGSVLMLSHRFGAQVTRVLRYSLKSFPALVRSKGTEVLEQIGLFQTVQWVFHLKILAHNLVRIALRAGMYLMAAKAAQIEIGYLTALWTMALVFVLGRLPISVGNLGVREATLVQALSIYGVEGSDALLMSMVVFSCLLLLALIGAAYQLFGGVSVKQRTDPPL